MQDERTVVVHRASELIGLPTRRGFLKALAAGGSLVLMPSVFAACNDNNTITGTTTTAAQTINLGTDAGIFTFAYVLEQLESSFYTQVVGLAQFSTLFSAAEREMLADIRNDEVTHREFLRTALGGSFPNLTFDFSSVNATLTRQTLLSTALALEDTGVAAYNGAGASIKNAANLLVAGKIVSVEARHASALADALDTTGTAYADLTAPVLAGLGANNTNALDVAAAPSVVLAKAQPFIVNTITLA